MITPVYGTIICITPSYSILRQKFVQAQAPPTPKGVQIHEYQHLMGAACLVRSVHAQQEIKIHSIWLKVSNFIYCLVFLVLTLVFLTGKQKDNQREELREVPNNNDTLDMLCPSDTSYASDTSNTPVKLCSEYGDKPKTRKAFFTMNFGNLHDGGQDVGLGHMIEYDKEWSRHIPFTNDSEFAWSSYERLPRPDYAEGIDQTILEDNIAKSYPTIIVNDAMALPNFIVEYKHKLSWDACTQNQHNGAIATRAWQEFVEQIWKGPDLQRSSSEVAQVCSVEFNGDTMAANIH